MKRLIVCCDGTWNSALRPNKTNVYKLEKAIADRDDKGTVQEHEYFEGVGNGPFNKFRGGIFGRGLGAHVREAYAYVIENYEPGDQIYLFGFSRGAYTVRSLGGLIRNCGVLRVDDPKLIDAAYDLYRRR